MPKVLTSLVELAVGAACIAAGAGAWRSGLRPVATLMAIAGVAAVVHAVASL